MSLYNTIGGLKAVYLLTYTSCIRKRMYSHNQFESNTSKSVTIARTHTHPQRDRRKLPMVSPVKRLYAKKEACQSRDTNPGHPILPFFVKGALPTTPPIVRKGEDTDFSEFQLCDAQVNLSGYSTFVPTFLRSHMLHFLRPSQQETLHLPFTCRPSRCS